MTTTLTSMRLGGRTAKILVVALLATMAFTVTYAQYTSTATITVGTSTSIATVTPSAPSLAVVEGETATKSLGTIFTVSSIDPAYDDAIRLSIYLLNPDVLSNYYSYFLVNLKVQENTAAADGSVWNDVSGSSGYISLENGVIEFVPGVDFAGALNTASSYRVVGTVTYHNFETTGLVAPSFYLDVDQ